jgi:Uncharacterised nucleotidyltransferase
MHAAYALAADAVEAEACETLRAAGARPIMLKGRSIADLLYPEGGRLSGDVDLLVDPAREHEATEALASLGYRHHWLGPTPRLSGGEMWVRSPRQPPIDLHVSLPFVALDPEAAFALLAARTVEARSGSGAVARLDTPGVALHVALHALLDGPDNPRTLEDLRRGCERLSRGTWREAAALAAELEVTDGLAAGLSLLAEGRELAGELELPSAPDSLIASLAARGLPKLAPGVLALASEHRWTARMRTLSRLLAPSPARQRDRWVLARRGTAGLIASYVAWPFYLAVTAPRLAVALVQSWWRSKGRRGT